MNFGDAMVGLGLSQTLVTDGLHMSRLDLLSRREAFDFRFRKAWCIRSVYRSARFGSGHMTGVLSQVRLCRPSPFMFLSALD